MNSCTILVVKSEVTKDGFFGAYYPSMVPSQRPDSLSGLGQGRSKVMRRQMEEWRQTASSLAWGPGETFAFCPILPNRTIVWSAESHNVCNQRISAQSPLS